MGKRKKDRPNPPPDADQSVRQDSPVVPRAAGDAPTTDSAGETPETPAETTPDEPPVTTPETMVEPESAGEADGPTTATADDDHVPAAPPAPVFGTGLDDGAEVDFTSAGARETGTSRVPVEGRAAWTRLLKMSRPRATRANLLGALLAVLLGAGIAAQVQLTNQRGLDELSQTDLVRVLDDISLRSSRLDQQVRELEATRDRLKNGTGTAGEALSQAQKRVDTLGILAGTIAAKGPGITLRVSDPTNAVTGPIVLDIIQELRDAGAESIDVGGVRVVASSFVGDRGGQILVDGVPVPRPLVIKVIGDSKTLSSAMTIPGGIVESVRQKGAEAVVTESSLIEITSLHRPSEMTHAKPVE